MDEKMNTSETLPAVAARLREGLPQLQRRAFAVTEAQATKDNVPTLPVAIVAPLVQEYTHNGGNSIDVQEDFVVEVWLDPQREKTSDGGETPFWKYYAYNRFRDALFSLLTNGWRTPQGGTLRFVSMDVESNFLATVLTFRLRARYTVCTDSCDDEEPAIVSLSMCAPSTKCDPQCVDTEQEKCQ